MRMEPRQKQHAILSLLVLIGLVLFAYAVLVAPAMNMRRENQERIDNLVLQLHKYKTAEMEIGPLQKQIDTLTKTEKNNIDYLQEEVPSLAAANLQQHIKMIIESQGALLISSQPVGNNDQTELFQEATVKIIMRGDINALQAILYALESATPSLFLDNITIQQRYTAQARTNQKDADSLDVRFDVTGFINNTSI